MSKKKKAAAAGATAVEAVDAVKSNPYLQTITNDSDLHDNVRVAYESARDAYERLASGKSLVEVRPRGQEAARQPGDRRRGAQDVGTTLADPPAKKKAKKKKGGLGRKLLVLVVGAGVAVAVSSDVRNKLLDLLFGAEEEFDYTSTTAPSTPAPTS